MRLSLWSHLGSWGAQTPPHTRRSASWVMKCDNSPDEGLEGSALRVDAQRHPFALLVLRYEAVD